MDPLTIGLICAGVGALLGGGGTAVYLENDHQKEVAQLQEQIARLQTKVQDLQQRVAKKQRAISDLQARLADRESEIARLLKEQMDTNMLIASLEKRIERNSGFWAKIVAALQFKLGQLAVETESLREELAAAEQRAGEAGEQVLAIEAERARLETQAVTASEKVAELERQLEGLVARRSMKQTELQAMSA